MKKYFKFQVALFLFFSLLLKGNYGQQEQEQPAETKPTTSPSPPVAAENSTTVTTESNTTNSNSNNTDTDISIGAGAYDSNCTKDEECDGSVGFICNLSSNLCDCSRPKEMIFDTTKNACLVLESFSCEKIIQGRNASEFECTKNAVCEPTTTADKNNEKAGGKYCRCSEGYSPSSSRLCLGGFGQACQPETDPCNDLALLVCDMPSESEGKCGCSNPKESVFENGTCVTLAGGDCTFSEPPYNPTCTGNATCKLAENEQTKNTTGKCECNTGFKKREDGRCLHGSSTQLLGTGILLFLTIFISVSSIK